MPHSPSPLSVDPPISLDPREPPTSPRIGSRTPTRGHTPISSRAGSPHPLGHLHLPPSLLHQSGQSGSIPSSPVSTHHAHSREEDFDSAIFERDIEVPLDLGSTLLPSSPLPNSSSQGGGGGGGSGSPLLAAAITHSSSLHHFGSPVKASSSASPASHIIHHPHARASATDQVFPTVLDDAIEALSNSRGDDVFVVSPSRSGSPSGRSMRRSFGGGGAGEGLFGGEGGTSSGQRSPVMSFSGSVEGRERRSSTVSLTGQAGRMMDAGDAAHGFRLTLPGEDHPTLIPTSDPNSTHSSPPLGVSPSSPFPNNTNSSNPAINPNAHRLSFISPQDLIVSPPLSTLSLSSITSGASLPTSLSSPASAAQSPLVVAVTEIAGSPPASVVGEERGKPAGDEWEREGLGKGLEERLEDLLREGKAEQEK